MESLQAYIPIDRRAALAQGRDLPQYTTGAALFADISGFTPLTDALVRSLGPQRGAEELPHQLNRVYDALISEIDRFGGSVIGFSGDAITCWFDGDTGLRATASALAMQHTMQQFVAIPIPDGTTVALAIKVAVAVGPVRRFVVGDSAIQYIDVLAGQTLEHLAEAEHHANKGEVVLDAQACSNLEPNVSIVDWRVGQDSQRYAVIERLLVNVAPTPWPPLNATITDEEAVRAWLLPPVYERLRSGLGEFLTELRPAVALFLRFTGLDYDHDEAACEKLDAYIRWVQGILKIYGGYLIQLTVGDKGSYLYAAFGAPIAHDNDAMRAVAAALELRSIPTTFAFIESVQIGISRGRMRTGAYGGSTARTYGVLGPETNMAARLMQHAPVGEVLVNVTAQRETGDTFTWEHQPPLKVKGKVEPAIVFRLIAPNQRQAMRLQEPRYSLPMVGRARELAVIEQKMELAVSGKGQIVAITADAGMGKSRLVAEMLRRADGQGLLTLGGECQSYGTNNSYLVWESIWRRFFSVDHTAPLDDQVQALEAQLAAIAPHLVGRLPLLGMVLNLPIPDNDLTQALDAKLRKASLEALLVDCLRVRAKTTPLFVVLEDCHWLDPLSHDLLEVVGRAMADLPVMIVVAYRPPEVERLQGPRVIQLAHCTVIPLHDFTQEEAARLISLKTAQLSGDGIEPPPAFVQRITDRAQGNPFYIEELINYLRDCGLDPRDVHALQQLDLPTSLQSLILSRIDQLTENQKLTLKVASIIGRLFRLSWLWGVHPQLGEEQRVKADLEALSRIDLTPLDQPDPEFTYLFKHIVTREVAYESLPFATRELLHGQLGVFVEAMYADSLDQYVDLLAYHYDHSQNLAKRCEYLQKAGEAARRAYANDASIDYYRRLLPLFVGQDRETTHRQQSINTTLGELFVITGQYEDALEHLHTALALSAATADPDAKASACRWIARVYENRSEYGLALDWIQQGLEALGALDTPVKAEMLAIAGLIYTRQGQYTQALDHSRQSMDIAEQLGQTRARAFATNLLGHITRRQGQSAPAISFFEQALALYQQAEDLHGQALAHNNIANAYLYLGKFKDADLHYREARNIFDQAGDVYNRAFVDNNLGEIARKQGRLDEALHFYEAGLATLEIIGGSLYVMGVFHMNLGAILVQQGQIGQARQRLQMSQDYFAQAKSRDFLPELHRHIAAAAFVAGELVEAEQQGLYALSLARELSMRGEEGASMRLLGEVATEVGQYDRAQQYLNESAAIHREVKDEYEEAIAQFALARLYVARGQVQHARIVVEQSIGIFERIGAGLDLAYAQSFQSKLTQAARAMQ